MIMNVNTMLSLLGVRLEDAKATIFTNALKLDELNQAQNKLVQMLHTGYLTELQETETMTTATNGTLSMADLSYPVLRGQEGIISVRISGGRYATEITTADLKKMENSYLTGTDSNPLYHIFGNTIKLYTSTTSPVVDVMYIRLPAEMTYVYNLSTVTSYDAGTMGKTIQFVQSELAGYVNQTFLGASVYNKTKDSYGIVVSQNINGTIMVLHYSGDTWSANDEWIFVHQPHSMTLATMANSELNPSLHEIIITLAEGQCWGMDNKHDRRSIAMEYAYGEIKVLNERYTDAEGVGTKNR